MSRDCIINLPVAVTSSKYNHWSKVQEPSEEEEEEEEETLFL